MTAPLSEYARQRELDTYRVVDSLPEAAYDDIVRIASLVCGAPTALISVIDRDRQWFKASVGFDLSETPRDVAFCEHAIRAPDRLMEVRDATKDSRFANNPLVTTGEAPVRFYAGMPLVTPGGAAIGTVCVIDQVPRTLDEAQRDTLASLARLTMNLLEARHRERELERALALAQPPAPAPEAPPPDLSHCTVAIFEVQDAADAVKQRGDRAVERALHQLERAFESRLRPGLCDSVSRVSGCAELIVVLHGTDTGDALRALHDCVPEFEYANGLRVLSAHGASGFANERLELVYLRADEALSALKGTAPDPGQTES